MCELQLRRLGLTPQGSECEAPDTPGAAVPSARVVRGCWRDATHVRARIYVAYYTIELARGRLDHGQQQHDGIRFRGRTRQHDTPRRIQPRVFSTGRAFHAERIRRWRDRAETRARQERAARSRVMAASRARLFGRRRGESAARRRGRSRRAGARARCGGAVALLGGFEDLEGAHEGVIH